MFLANLRAIKGLVGIVSSENVENEPKRSMVKTLTWRTIATTDTFLIAWLITGAPLIGASIASIEVLTKMVLYYAHERAWNRSDWGRADRQYPGIWAKRVIPSIEGGSHEEER